MSGHSKWASIKHKKSAADAKRGKLFGKITRELTVSAKQGGSNPDTNPRLRVAIDKAKNANMPNDNIDRAIKRGTGELPGVNYEETSYEGYAQKGVAIIVDCLTDNNNRTTAEIRNIFAKKGGNMSGEGSVAWQFKLKGFITVKKDTADEEKVFNLSIENGAEDFKVEEDSYEIITPPDNFEQVKQTLSNEAIKYDIEELTKLPNSTVKIKDEKTASRILDLVETLESHDDVQNVYANFDIPDETLQTIANG